MNASRAIGAMFFAWFGGAWLAFWCVQAYGLQPAILALVAAGSLAIFLLALRRLRASRMAQVTRTDDPVKKQASRYFGIVNLVQWLLIFAVAIGLAKSGHPQWITAAIILVVGLHFLPLAAIFNYRPHYLTGVALILVAIGYPLVLPAGPASPVGALATGVILWISAIGALLAGTSSNPNPHD